MSEDASKVYDSFMNSLQRIFNIMKEYLKKKNMLTDKEAELLEKFLKGKGNIMGSTVLPEHYQEIKSELIKQNIPFTEIVGANNTKVFLVRENVVQDLLNIEQSVLAKDTRYAKELEINNTIKFLKAQKVKTTPVFTISKEMEEIAKQKMFQSGMTFSSYIDPKNSEKTNVVCFPTSLFSKNGKDAELFKLTYALTQTKTLDKFLSKEDREFNENLKKQNLSLEEYLKQRKETPLIKIRKEQAAYDKKEIENFIKEAKKGNNVILGNIFGGGTKYIEADNGRITVVDKRANTKQEIQYQKDDSLNILSATLSRYTEDIYNMKTVRSDFYKSTLEDKIKDINILPDEYKNNLRPDFRGSADKQLRIVNDFFNEQFEEFIRDVNMKATDYVNNQKVYRFDKQAELKHQEIIRILKDHNSDPVKGFLEKEEYINNHYRLTGTDYELNLEELIETLTENFENENQENEYEVEVQPRTVREIQRAIVDEENHVEKAYEPEYE